MTTLLTVGHGEASQAQLTDLLLQAQVGLVVDVRRFPGSRRHPQFGQAGLEQWLPASGVDYRWEARLGGRRRLAPELEGLDAWWRVDAFRAYAAHTRTDEFAAGAADLLADVAAPLERRVAVMCSESLWWRCHRRLVADVMVLLHHVQVQHLAHDGKLTEHVPAAGARVDAGELYYDRADTPS